jgi:uncharacterized membrane protein
MATVEQTPMTFGWRVFGFGIMALALVDLAWGDFDSGLPVPNWIPGRTALAYASAMFLLVAGAALEWRRTTARAAAALVAYYTLVVVLLMNGRVIFDNAMVFGAYSTAAEELAVAMGALIVYAANASIDAALAVRLTRVAQLTFGVCAVLFGIAHFVYMNYTAPLVPKWLPPSPEFWGYATGLFHIAAGIAILTGAQARLAAILLTVMYASFTPLVHLPMLLANHATQFVWSENALNIILTGAAWVIADSLARPR